MPRSKGNKIAPQDVAPETFESKEEETKEPDKAIAVENTAPQDVAPAASYGRRWRACSWLSNEGRTIAEPGDELVLSDALSSHYLKAAPGSIEPAEIIH